jgi:hypothetical protein
MMMNGELKTIRKEGVLAYFKSLPSKLTAAATLLSGITEELCSYRGRDTSYLH